MITAIIISLVAGIFYLLFRMGKSGGSFASRESKGNLFILLMIGILTVVALFTPEARKRIEALRRKLNL